MIENMDDALKSARREARSRGMGGGIRRDDIPEVDDLSFGPELKKLRDEFDQLIRRQRAVRTELEAIPSAIRDAEEADARARADALRSGQPEPPAAAPDVVAREQALRREKLTIAASFDAIGGDLAALVRKNRDKWPVEVEDAVPGLRQAGKLAVAELRQVHRQLGRYVALASWIRRGGNGPLEPGAGTIRLDGGSVSVASLLDALGALFDEPQPKVQKERSPESQAWAEEQAQVLTGRRYAGGGANGAVTKG